MDAQKSLCAWRPLAHPYARAELLLNQVRRTGCSVRAAAEKKKERGRFFLSLSRYSIFY